MNQKQALTIIMRRFLKKIGLRCRNNNNNKTGTVSRLGSKYVRQYGFVNVRMIEVRSVTKTAACLCARARKRSGVGAGGVRACVYVQPPIARRSQSLSRRERSASLQQDLGKFIDDGTHLRNCTALARSLPPPATLVEWKAVVCLYALGKNIMPLVLLVCLLACLRIGSAGEWPLRCRKIANPPGGEGEIERSHDPQLCCS